MFVLFQIVIISIFHATFQVSDVYIKVKVKVKVKV